MKRFTHCQLGLAVALSALTLAAHAQQPANTAPSGTSATAPSENAQPGHADNAHATAKHAMSHHAKRHASHASATMETSGPDSQYKAALRQCVTGPASQRDTCLDRAISRYARA